jgi:hypothetical protein
MKNFKFWLISTNCNLPVSFRFIAYKMLCIQQFYFTKLNLIKMKKLNYLLLLLIILFVASHQLNGQLNCSNAINIPSPVGYTINSSTQGAVATSYCGSPAQWTGGTRVFTLNTNLSFTVRLQGNGSTDFDIIVLSSCNPSNCIGRSTFNGSGNEEVTICGSGIVPTFQSNSLVLYYIVVHAYQGNGNFTLWVDYDNGGFGQTGYYGFQNLCSFPQNNSCGTITGTLGIGAGNNIRTYYPWNTNLSVYADYPALENVHRIPVNSGTLTANLTSVSNSNIDVALLELNLSTGWIRCVSLQDNIISNYQLSSSARYFVVVDSRSSSAGQTYTLNISYSGCTSSPPVPSCATVLTPLEGATLSGNPAITWQAVSNATGYRLTVGTTPSGAQILNNFDVGNKTYHILPNLQASTIFVRVIPYNNNGPALNCPQRIFNYQNCTICPPGLDNTRSDCIGFENYSNGNLLSQGAPLFSLFSNTAQQQATVVNTFAFSGTKSLRFSNTSNIDYNIDNPTLKDVARLEWMMNIPTGKSGAWGVETNSSTTYAILARYNNGICSLYQATASGNTSATPIITFAYPVGSWFKVKILFFASSPGNQGSIEIMQNNQLIYRVSNYTSNIIGDLNFHNIPNSTNGDYYIDNLCYQELFLPLLPCTQEFMPVCVNGKVFNNRCLARRAGYIDEEIIDGDCTDDYCEGNFENYPTGNISIFSTSDNWVLWPNGGDGVVTTERAFSGTKSLKITSSSPQTDLVYKLGNKTTADGNWDGNDVYRYSWKMYVPTSNGAYYNMQHSESLNHWAYEVHFNQNGTGELRYGTLATPRASFTYPKNQWFSVTQIIRLGSDEAELWINGRYVSKWRFSTGTITNNVPSDLNQIGAINFYGNPNLNSLYYIDDFICDGNRERCFGIQTCEPFPAVVCVNGQQFGPVDGTNCGGLQAYCAGYSEEEWTLGPCSSYCDGCYKCFKYIPKYEAPRTMKFFSQYCDDWIGRGSNYSAQWTVTGGTVQYIDNTTASSLNPVMLFPSNGNYTVCYKLFLGTSLIYECCQTIVIGTCNNGPVAYFTATHNSTANTFTLLSTGTSGSNIKWEFSEPGVQFVTGNASSTTPVISIPNGTCVNVCLVLSNACGMSTYCLKLCRSNTACAGTTPPVYFTGVINPSINDRTVSINLPTNSQATFKWDLGNGSAGPATQNLSYTYPAYGNYIICVEVRIGCFIYCYCWCVHLRPCGGSPAMEPHDGMLSARFLGNQTTLQYQIQSSNITIAPNQPWLVDDVPVSNSTGQANLTVAMPQSRDYVICFPYIKPNGCLAYKCIRVRGGNPFSCTNINWRFVQNQGFQFNLVQSSGITEILWTVDETGQQIGTSATSNFILPPNPCAWRNISVRYFDGTRYWICCLRIYLCLPDDCFNTIFYGATSNEQALFRLEESGATNIQWYFDDAPNTTLGTTSTITLPYPATCVARWISVKYFIPGIGWKICCRLIWFCNPFNCNQIKMTYSEGSGFRFELDQTYQNMSWVIDETNQSLGTGVQSNFYPVSGTECVLRTVTVRYRDAQGRWWICCYRFWWCNPMNCSDKITITPSGTNHILSTDNTAQNITWFRENVQLGTGNNLTVSLPTTGSYKIYIRYYNPANKTWYWCCRTFTPGSGGVQCNNMQVVFREDFSSGPPNGFGYTLGQSIISNQTWWAGDATSVVKDLWEREGEANNDLVLKIGNNIPNASKIKIKFDILSFWSFPPIGGIGGSFCLGSEQQCFIPTFTDLYNSNIPGLISRCTGFGYCYHPVEILIDRSGPVLMFIDSIPMPISDLNDMGGQITRIYFSSGMLIDNVEVSICDHTGPTNKVVFDVDDNICGQVGQIIDVPIRTRNFNKVSNFQFSAGITSPNSIEFTGVVKGNIPDILSGNLTSPSSARILWEEVNQTDLPDNTVVAILKVRIKQNFSGTLPIVLSGSPLEAYAQQDGQDVVPTLINGSVCVGSNTYRICGKVTRDDNQPVGNVTVQLSGGLSRTITTSSNGEYCFEDLPAGLNYVITPRKNINHVNGVNSGDVTAIRRQILGIENLNSPYKVVAADARKSNAVNSGDVTEIRRLILGIIPEFETIESWTFIPKSHVFSNPQNPFASAIPATISVNNLGSNITNADFTGIKTGDVNLSNNPGNIFDNLEVRSNNIELIVSSANVVGNQIFEIDVTVRNFIAVSSAQFSISWNNQVAQFIELRNLNTMMQLTSNNFNTMQTGSGRIGFQWDSATNLNLSDNSRLFTIRFTANNSQSSTPIQVTGQPTSIYFGNASGDEYGVTVNNGTITVPTDDYNFETLIKMYPNPTSGIIFLESGGNQISEVTIMNVTGQEQVTQLVDNSIDMSTFNPGVYFVKGRVNNIPFLKKLVLIK